MTPDELLRWQAYERVEPWGERRQDVRHGRLLAALANVHRVPAPGGRPAWTGEDFYPYRGAEAPGEAVSASKPRGDQRPRTPLGAPVMTHRQMAGVLGLFMAANNARLGQAPPAG